MSPWTFRIRRFPLPISQQLIPGREAVSMFPVAKHQENLPLYPEAEESFVGSRAAQFCKGGLWTKRIRHVVVVIIYSTET